MRGLTSALFLILASLPAPPAAAQDAHDLWHPIYETWQRPDGKGGCCNKHDCRPVTYRTSAAGVEIRIDELGGIWQAVPPKTILPFSSFDSDAHACYLLQRCVNGGTAAPCAAAIRCVALPMNM